MKKWEIQPLLSTKPLPMATICGMGDDVGDSYPCAKFYYDRISFLLPISAPSPLAETHT